jgi:hypothetical protein
MKTSSLLKNIMLKTDVFLHTLLSYVEFGYKNPL